MFHMCIVVQSSGGVIFVNLIFVLLIFVSSVEVWIMTGHSVSTVCVCDGDNPLYVAQFLTV